jgi:hypothetical protein
MEKKDCNPTSFRGLNQLKKKTHTSNGDFNCVKGVRVWGLNPKPLNYPQTTCEFIENFVTVFIFVLMYSASSVIHPYQCIMPDMGICLLHMDWLWTSKCIDYTKLATRLG